ncbi:MAG: hypothetical protein ABIC40_08685 [bacterium]
MRTMTHNPYAGVIVVRVLIPAFILFCTLFQTPVPLRAEEEEISFNSDYQQEVREEEVLLLQGNVEVKFRDLTIYADEVRLNDKKKEFFGVGNVHMVGTDRDIYGDSIWYDYSKDDFDMGNANGSLIAQGVSEPVWSKSERLKGNVKDYKMINARVTTCEPDEHREYHIEARSIKVLADNKIIFRNGYLFITNVPIIWFPYWSYSIAKTPWTVKVGKDPTNGTYVETTYNFLDEELVTGILIMNYYSRRGEVIGTNHDYVLPKHGTGSLDWLYRYGRFRNPTTGEITHRNEYQVALSQAIKFGNRFTGNLTFRSNSQTNYQGNRTNDNSGSFNAGYKVSDSNTQFNFTGSTTSGYRTGSRINTSLSHTRTIFDDIQANAKCDYSVDKGDDTGPANEDLKTHIDFRQSLKGWSWSALMDSHWDADQDTNIRDQNIKYTDKMPEINLKFNQGAFPARYRNPFGFQMSSLDLLGGLYYIGTDLDKISAFYGRLETGLSKSYNLSKKHKIQSDVNYWQAISSTGDARYTYGTRVRWTWNITKPLTWEIGWSRNDDEGRIPLSGLDRPSTPQNNATWSLNWQNAGFSMRLNTSYNFKERFTLAGAKGIPLLTTLRLQPFNISFTYNPSNRSNASLNTSYNVRTDKWGSISARYNMTDFQAYKMDSTININVKDGKLSNAQFSTIQTNATILIGEDLDLTLKTELAPRVGESYFKEIGVTYRLDCTFLRAQFRKSGSTKEYFITWGVTGYPTLGLNYNTGQQAFGPDFFNSFAGTGGGFQTSQFGFGGSTGGGSYY